MMRRASQAAARIRWAQLRRLRGMAVRNPGNPFSAPAPSLSLSRNRPRPTCPCATLTALRVADVLVSDPCPLLRHVSAHFASRFAAHPAQLRRWTLSLDRLPRLCLADATVLNVPLSRTELNAAIRALPTRTSPGPDGISAELLRYLWFHWPRPLTAVFTSLWCREKLPPAFIEAVMILLPKPTSSEGRLSVDNWRPITISNVDYRVYARMLLYRLQMVAGQLLHPAQFCGPRGRSPLLAIELVRLASEAWRNHPCSAFLVSLDFQKAHDSVVREALWAVLHHCGVGPGMLQALTALYDAPRLRAAFRGFLGDPFVMYRGVKQGCPLASLLFAFFTDPVVRALSSVSPLRGFAPCPSLPYVSVVAYADDWVLLVEGLDSLLTIRDILQRFQDILGLTLNPTKCRGIIRGPPSPPPCWPAPSAWCPSFTFLGIPVGDPGQEGVKRTEIFGKAHRAAFCARICTGSLRTRALLLNARVWSCFPYALRHLPWPDRDLRRVARLLAVALWGRTYEPIRRTTVFLPPSRGGLGLVSPHVARTVLRFTLFRKLLTDPSWAPYFHSSLSAALPQFFPRAGPPTTSRMPRLYSSFCPGLSLLRRFERLNDAWTLSPSSLYRLFSDLLLPHAVHRVTLPDRLHDNLLLRIQRVPVFPRAKSFYGWTIRRLCRCVVHIVLA